MVRNFCSVGWTSFLMFDDYHEGTFTLRKNSHSSYFSFLVRFIATLGSFVLVPWRRSSGLMPKSSRSARAFSWFLVLCLSLMSVPSKLPQKLFFTCMSSTLWRTTKSIQYGSSQILEQGVTSDLDLDHLLDSVFTFQGYFSSHFYFHGQQGDP